MDLLDAPLQCPLMTQSGHRASHSSASNSMTIRGKRSKLSNVTDDDGIGRCNQCHQAPIEIDNRGERLIGWLRAIYGRPLLANGGNGCPKKTCVQSIS